MKNDFGGHDNHHHHNVYAFVGQAVGAGTPMLDGHEEYLKVRWLPEPGAAGCREEIILSGRAAGRPGKGGRTRSGLQGYAQSFRLCLLRLRS